MPETRRSPGIESRATSTPPSADTQFTAYRPEDGYQAPPAEDRADDAFLAEMLARGYRPSVDCLICGHPLSSKQSVAIHIGPKCLAKLAAAQAEGGEK